MCIRDRLYAQRQDEESEDAQDARDDTDMVASSGKTPSRRRRRRPGDAGGNTSESCDCACDCLLYTSTVFQVPWTRIGSEARAWPYDGFEVLKGAGFTCFAMALSDDSVSDVYKRQGYTISMV